jgi:hypothetical protein
MKKRIYTGALLFASLAHAQEVHIMDTQEQDAAIVQQLINHHFEIWNDTNPEQRLSKYPAVYTRDIFVADYAGKAVGYANVQKKIDEVHGSHPGFVFRPEPARWNHGLGRVTWGYGPENAPNLVRGEDIFTIEDGKLASLRVFIDQK